MTAAETQIDALAQAMRFDPSGKGWAMKDWLHVPPSLGVDWLVWAESARKFVHDHA
jgi:hypothetical protein